jgi:ABC-type sugar transport system ATPase subunit
MHEFFNRKEVLAALNEVFDDSPSELLILLGPANCGKSVSFYQPS